VTELDRATVIGALHREPRLADLLGVAGQGSAAVIADVALGYTHDGYLSRRGVVDALSISVPPVFGDHVRRANLLEAHAVADVMEQLLRERPTVHPDARPAEIEMTAADFVAQAPRMLEWAYQGTVVTITAQGQVFARLVPERHEDDRPDEPGDAGR
jgi:hypothetical protein